MKRTGWILFASAIAPAAMGQVINSPSENGWAAATASAFDWRYVQGSMGRGGHYWYWREFTDKVSQVSAVMPLNGNTGAQTATSTFYSPSYSATCYGSTSLTNTSTTAVYNVLLQATSKFDPTLGTNKAASVSNDVLSEFFYNMPSSQYVSVKVTAGQDAIVGFKNTDTGETYFWGYGSGSFSDTLEPGHYELFIHLMQSASKDAHSGLSSNLGSMKTSVRGQISVSAADGGG